ncbi:hypothetical protein [Paragemmobacter straminiformis]|uniref:DUF3137 domain-containing protein n=1 Tax=Paragemmobacter straminiformis TaxID=2045119 RepID=A0A842I9L7_9RHOB|nr:hypothetical protein [Gemmobacter straminiformis]MBC2835678.1 hypothetical protein [Gemmobacter straminiformis]
MAEAFVLAAFAALLGAVLLLSRRRQGRVLARRAALLDPCRRLFADTRLRCDAFGFPRMAGTRDGLSYDIQIVPDALAVRKLPALWLLVSLPQSMPVAFTLHLMLRPTGAEGFTRFRSLPNQHDLPAGFPADAALRSDDPVALALAPLLQPLVTLWGDTLKEIILSPKGLRLTLLLEEADRKTYLILRETDLGQTPVNPAALSRALDALAGLRAALHAPAPERQVA